MPKTFFTAGVSKITAVFANLLFNHKHDGLDQDGSVGKIDFTQIDDRIKGILDQVVSIIPVISKISYLSKPRLSVFAGNEIDGDFVASAINNLLDKGVYNFKSFTIDNGFTVNATGGICRIKVTGNATINGFLTGIPDVNNPIATGALTESDARFNLEASLRGSSGALAHNSTDRTGIGVILGRGGKPGTTIIIECLGTLTIGATGRISSDGGVGQETQIVSSGNSASSGGGGTGGAIILMSLTAIVNNGILSSQGGKGGNGKSTMTNGTGSLGSGGGSGGYAYLAAPSISGNDLQILLNGGVAGLPANDGSYAGVSGGSFANRGGSQGQAGETGRIIKVLSDIFHIY